MDQYLASGGRLVLLESVEDVQTRIVLARRNRPERPENRADTILQRIVDQIIRFADAKHPSPIRHEGVSLDHLATAGRKRSAETSNPELTK